MKKFSLTLLALTAALGSSAAQAGMDRRYNYCVFSSDGQSVDPSPSLVMTLVTNVTPADGGGFNVTGSITYLSINQAEEYPFYIPVKGFVSPDGSTSPPTTLNIDTDRVGAHPSEAMKTAVKRIKSIQIATRSGSGPRIMEGVLTTGDSSYKAVCK